MVLSLDKCKKANEKKATGKKWILAATEARVCIYEMLNWHNCS